MIRWCMLLFVVVLVGCTQNPQNQEIETMQPQTELMHKNGIEQGLVLSLTNEWSLGLEMVYDDTYFDLSGAEQTVQMARFSFWNTNWPKDSRAIALVLPVGARFTADKPYIMTDIKKGGITTRGSITFAEQSNADAPQIPAYGLEQGVTRLLEDRWVMRVKHIHEGDYTDASGMQHHGLIAQLVLENQTDASATKTIDIPLNGTFHAGIDYTITELHAGTDTTRGWLVLDK